jgi:alanyl aminopeptidase
MARAKSVWQDDNSVNVPIPVDFSDPIMKLPLPAIAALVAASCISACQKIEQSIGAHAATPQATRAVPLAMLPRVIVPDRYRLSFVIDPRKENFSGHTEIDVTIVKPQTSFFIHGLDLRVSRAVARLASGAMIPATYKQVDDSGVDTLSFAKPVPAGRATLIFDYEAPFNTSLSGLYKVVDRGDAYAFTQFENIDARRAFPSFDEPGFKTPFDVTITAPSEDKVIANTPVMRNAATADGMTKWVFETTKPLPTYLVQMAVGPLDIVDAGDVPPNQYRKFPLHLRGIAAKGMGPKLKYALSLTPAIVTALENYYGIGYPFQKLDTLAVPDFSAGAMENAGAITYREQLLLMDANAPLEQRRSSLTVQAHEIAHQWFGDLVTPRWWDDIWLNESFATWMEYKIAQTVHPDEEFARATLGSSLGVMRLDELPSARQIHNPVRNPDDIDNAFDDITYSKGGAVLSMFESFVGPEEFRKGIHAYLTKFAYRNATAQDFIGTIAQTTGHPEMVQSFNDFIDQPHIPLMQAAMSCAGSPTARIREATYRPIGIHMPEGRWHVPMCLEADNRSRVCRMAGPHEAVVPLDQTCPKVLFSNAEGAGYYRFTGDEAYWQSLIANAAALSPADQLALFHNLTAALRAGQASAGDLFALMRVLAPGATWDTIGAIREVAHELRVTGTVRSSDMQKLIRGDFGPRLKQTGIEAKSGESAATSLMRQRLAEILVEEGRDPALTQRLAHAADVYITSNGQSLDSLPPELLQEAMRAGVMAGDAGFADKVIAAIQSSNDEYFTQSAIYALAGSSDPATLEKLLALSLTPVIRTGDLRYVQRYYAAQAAARPVLWSWFKANFPTLEKRLSRYGMGGAPDIQRFGCAAADKADLESFLGPKAAQLVGMPRVLKENEERIDRCIAFKAAKGAEIEAALASAR